MKACSTRQFVETPVPYAHLGVGRALRRAFPAGAPASGLKPFEDLLGRLDDPPAKAG